MCSIGEDDFGDEGGLHTMVAHVVDAAAVSPPGSLCKKCGQQGELYKLAFREAECRDCFLMYARHKFRATLGASKALPRNASVLLVFDGSAEAAVLLDMVRYAQVENTFKRLHCSLRLLYVDDQQLLQPTGTPVECREPILQLRDWLVQYENLDAFVVPLGSSQAQPPHSLTKLEEYLQRQTAAETEFAARVLSIRSLTSRQDFVKLQRNRRISSAAQHLHCEFVFVPDISTHLAADLLSAVAMGRGGSAALDVALLDDRLGDGVTLIRPLKDLTEAEVELYLRAQELKPLQVRRWDGSQGGASSVQSITRAFVDNLQRNYASTVSTVYRTGNKIAPNRELHHDLAALKLDPVAAESGRRSRACSFCNATLDCSDSTTLLAVRFSRFVSQIGGTAPEKYSNAEQWQHGSEENDALRGLCHGCRNIQRDLDNNLLDLRS